MQCTLRVVCDRFDLLAGVNDEDANIMLAIDTGMYAMMSQRSIEQGVSMDFAREYLTFECPHWFTPFSPELCADFVISNYGLETAANDKDRALRLRDFLGKLYVLWCVLPRTGPQYSLQKFSILHISFQTRLFPSPLISSSIIVLSLTLGHFSLPPSSVTSFTNH